MKFVRALSGRRSFLNRNSARFCLAALSLGSSSSVCLTLSVMYPMLMMMRVKGVRGRGAPAAVLDVDEPCRAGRRGDGVGRMMVQWQLLMQSWHRAQFRLLRSS